MDNRLESDEKALWRQNGKDGPIEADLMKFLSKRRKSRDEAIFWIKCANGNANMFTLYPPLSLAPLFPGHFLFPPLMGPLALVETGDEFDGWM